MKEFWRSIVITGFAFIPARYVSMIWTKGKDTLEYDLSWIGIYIVFYLLANYLTRPRTPIDKLKLKLRLS